MIRNGEITKKQAKKKLRLNYMTQLNSREIKYFCKKLDFSLSEFDEILYRKPKPHQYYKSDQVYFDFLKSFILYVSKRIHFFKSFRKKIGLR